MNAIARLVAEERLGAVATVIGGEQVGTKAVLDGSAVIAGELPASIADDVIADAETLMAKEQSRTLEYGGTAVFIETIAPPPQLLIFGAVHVAQPLSSMATQMGYRVVVTDPRETFTTSERFPDADRVLVGWPDDLKDHVEIDARTYVVMLSHDARFEDPALPWVLASPAKYIGAMGSRKTTAKRREKLSALGYGQSQIDRIHGPIGLDIGGTTPAETAVAILGEMTMVRHGHGAGEPLRGTSSSIHARPADNG